MGRSWIAAGPACFALLGLLPTVGPASAQDRPPVAAVTILGEVVDGASGRPLENVVVRISPGGMTLLSDSLGRFEIRDIPLGDYQMVLTRRGYLRLEGDFQVLRPGSFRVEMEPLEFVPGSAPGRIEGRILDPETQGPVRDATVTLVGTVYRTFTDRYGRFSLPEVPPGQRILRVEMLGRETREDTLFVEVGQLLEVNLRLAVEPIALEGITVLARPRWLVAAGFYRRRGRGYEGGQWTREELAAQDPVFLQDLLTTVQGIQDRGVRGVYGRRGCRLTVFVDDFAMDPGFDLSLIDPRNVEAMEVFHGTGKPVEFYRYCGVVLVWLKAGGE